MAQDRSRWTILVYMAGDNDLDPEAVEDVREMLERGTGSGFPLQSFLARHLTAVEL